MPATEYKTKQRALVEDVLKKCAQKHFTVDELAEELSAKGEKVGRTTVYRCLERLCDEGKVQKYSAAGESACYQYLSKEDCHEHFHLKCTSCGKLIHIECEHISSLAEHIASAHGFSVNKLKTVLYGVCEECAAE